MKKVNKVQPNFNNEETIYYLEKLRHFPVWLRNQLISTGLEKVLRHTEKSYSL